MAEDTLTRDEILALEARYRSAATRIPFFPIVVEQGSGATFTDAQGRTFLDFHAMARIANTGSVLRLAPPLIIGEAEVDRALAILDEALAAAVDGRGSEADVAHVVGW